MTYDEAKKLITGIVSPPPNFHPPDELVIRSAVLEAIEAQAIITAAETEKRVREEIIDKYGGFDDGCGCCAQTTLKEALESDAND